MKIGCRIPFFVDSDFVDSTPLLSSERLRGVGVDDFGVLFEHVATCKSTEFSDSLFCSL